MLSLQPKRPIFWDLYQEYVESIPEGDAYFTLHRPLILPHRRVTSLEVITDDFQAELLVTVNSQSRWSLQPSIDGVAFLDQSLPKGYGVRVPLNVRLALGENLIEVRSVSGETSRLFVVCLVWASVVYALANNLYQNIAQPMDLAASRLKSPWSALYLGNKLAQRGLLPDLVSSHAARMSTSGLLVKPGSEQALISYIRGLTYNTPALRRPSAAGFMETHLDVSSTSMTLRGVHANVWLPSTEIVQWLAFARGVDNQPDRYQVQDFDFLSIDLETDLGTEPHRFDRGRGGLPDFRGMIEAYPGSAFLRLKKSSRYFYLAKRWTHKLFNWIRKPLGLKFLNGTQLLDGTEAHLNSNDGVDIYAWQDGVPLGFEGSNVSSFLFAGPSANVPVQGLREGWFPTGSVHPRGPQARHLGFHARAFTAVDPVVGMYTEGALALSSESAGTYSDVEEIALPLPAATVYGDLLIWAVVSVDFPIASMSPGIFHVMPFTRFVVDSRSVYQYLLGRYQLSTTPAGGTLLFRRDVLRVIGPDLSPSMVEFQASSAGVALARVTGQHARVPIVEHARSYQEGVTQSTLAFTVSGIQALVGDLAINDGTFTVPPDPLTTATGDSNGLHWALQLATDVHPTPGFPDLFDGFSASSSTLIRSALGISLQE